MREEALKRLDEFVDSTCARCEGEYDFDDKRAAWAALRAELAAERCENCAHWGSVTHYCKKAKTLDAGLEVIWWADTPDTVEGGAELETTADYCCLDFEKRATP